MTDMRVGGGPTFTQIFQDFATQGKGGDKHIRFSDEKGLYLHKGFSRGFGLMATQDRAAKHGAGASQIKDAIDRQFGAGTADKVFKSIQEQTNRDLNQGVKRSDLLQIKRAIEAEITLDKVLDPHGSPELSSAFLGYANKRFIGENVEFLHNLSALRTLDAHAEPDRVRAALSDLGENFVKTSGDKAVNIDSDTQKAILRDLSNLDQRSPAELNQLKEAFDTAEQEIRLLVTNDVLRPFKLAMANGQL